MTVIRRIQALSPVEMWGNRISLILREYSGIVHTTPSLASDDAHQTIETLKDFYRQVQYSMCPDTGDEAYTWLTRSILNLTLSYDATIREDWSQSDVFYQRAISEWYEAEMALRRIGALSKIA